MGRKSIKETVPLTAAEKQKRYRNKQKTNMTEAQKFYAAKQLYNEMRGILDGLSNSELYAIAPIMRYMELSKKLLGKERNLRGVVKDTDLNFLFEDFCVGDLQHSPDAEFNLPDEDKAEINL